MAAESASKRIIAPRGRGDGARNIRVVNIIIVVIRNEISIFFVEKDGV